MTWLNSLRFHLKHGWFNVIEQFSDWASGIAGFLLFPFFIWLLAQLWRRFNAYQGNYTLTEVMLYVGTTEILFMTFLRVSSLTRASADFSLALARPRSWLVSSFSGLMGRCLGTRLVYLGMFVVIMPILGASVRATVLTSVRLIVLLPILGLVQGLIGLLFASAQVLWEETSYFALPISKIFLALGGVFAPLIDFGQPWRRWLIALPPSDVFFQPAHFCVKGEFYGISGAHWLLRVGMFCIFLWIANQVVYRQARRYHQSYGG